MRVVHAICHLRLITPAYVSCHGVRLTEWVLCSTADVATSYWIRLLSSFGEIVSCITGIQTSYNKYSRAYYFDNHCENSNRLLFSKFRITNKKLLKDRFDI
uniref:Uncharacterized protein n=1 Tax=Cacopsylla melanoneura TaxID=428564 RepID=A0A8D8Q6J9_9HEMI